MVNYEDVIKELEIFNSNGSESIIYSDDLYIYKIFRETKKAYLENKFSTLYQDNQEIEIIGVITKEGQEKEYRIEYEIKVESINWDEKYKNTKLILYVKNKEKIEYGKKVKLIRWISKTSQKYKL